MKCFNCNANMKLLKERDISYYNNLFDIKLFFSCAECGAAVNAYPPKNDPPDVPIRRSGEHHG